MLAWGKGREVKDFNISGKQQWESKVKSQQTLSEHLYGARPCARHWGWGCIPQCSRQEALEPSRLRFKS